MNKPLDIQIKELLQQYPAIELAILLGSAAKNQLSKSSDIDIAISTREPLTTILKREIIQTLGNHFGRPIDVINLREASPLLTAEILKSSKRLLGSDKTYGEFLSRHIMNYEDFAHLQKRLLKERHEQWINQ